MDPELEKDTMTNETYMPLFVWQKGQCVCLNDRQSIKILNMGRRMDLNAK